MTIRRWCVTACSAAILVAAPVGFAQSGASTASTGADGLAKVDSKWFDEVYLSPGASLRGYKKVMLDAAQVAFAGNWRRDLNTQRIALLERTTTEDADRIASKVRTGFDETFASAFKRAGYEIVAVPGPDVMRLSPRLTDVSINAPETITLSVPNRVYTLNAGEATLDLDLFDSTTGALLGRVHDRRTAGDRGAFRSSFMRTTPVSNSFDFGRLFDLWARGSVRVVQQGKPAEKG